MNVDNCAADTVAQNIADQNPGEQIIRAASEFARMWTLAMGNAGMVSGERSAESWDSQAILDVISGSALLGLVENIDVVYRAVDTVRMKLAGETLARSRRELGSEGLARSRGHSSGNRLLVDTWGVNGGEVHQLGVVAEATRPRRSLTGESLPPKYPAVAAAVNAGRVNTTQAGVIVQFLDQIHTATADKKTEAEQFLTKAAPDVTLSGLKRLCVQVRDQLDPDGVEPKAEAQRARRSLVFREERDGTARIDWLLPPEDAALVITGLDAIITSQLRRPEHTVADGATQYPERNALSMAQLRSDAAVAVFQHAAGCENRDRVGSAFQVVVRMTLDQLTDATGAVTIDGITDTIPVAAARRIACSAGIVPVVLDGVGKPLDVGRTKRLFPEPLKIALAERDRGCAWSGCEAPPSWCDAHHVQHWRHGGETSLDNGVLLCRRHHHLLHEGGWDIHVRDGNMSLIPPPWIDPHQTPRPMPRTRTAVPPIATELRAPAV